MIVPGDQSHLHAFIGESTTMTLTTPPPELAELAYGCRILYGEGHSDMTLGHLALHDADSSRCSPRG
jgi:hypothetical protein